MAVRAWKAQGGRLTELTSGGQRDEPSCEQLAEEGASKDSLRDEEDSSQGDVRDRLRGWAKRCVGK
jgi:hypothetical protein